jgi:hypothetical protein
MYFIGATVKATNENSKYTIGQKSYTGHNRSKKAAIKACAPCFMLINATRFILFIAGFALINALPDGVRLISGAPSGTDYVYIPISLAVNRKDAEKACESLGLSLAPIPTVEDLFYVGGLIREEAWVRSFRGRLEGECIAAFRGGAIAIPVGECNSNHAVLCK